MLQIQGNRGLFLATVTTFVFILFILPSVYAAPSITILSPQNATYSAYDPILINVTSNEPADFFIKARSGRSMAIVRNVTHFESHIYGSRASVNFTIFANNSGGSAGKSVVFTINHSSIINVTECGGIGYTNDTYVLQNDLSGGYCIFLGGATGWTFDMNGHSITGSTPVVGDCVNAEIINGNVTGDPAFYLAGSKCRIRNMSIVGGTGMYMETLSNSLLEDVTIKNTPFPLVFIDASSIVMRRMILESNQQPDSTAFWYENNFVPDTSMFIESSRAENFTNDFYFYANSMDVYLRNNKIDPMKVHGDSYVLTRTRMFKEHLANITIEDQNGNDIAASIELLDNGVLPRADEESNTYTLLSNPTGRVVSGTDPNGHAEVYVTEKLIAYKSESPISSEEFEFGPYQATARSANGLNQTFNISVNINSTFDLNFTVTIGGGTSLPPCTIGQMLDLNNDGAVNSKDAQVILRYMVGHNVTVNGTKQCNAVNFLPVH